MTIPMKIPESVFSRYSTYHRKKRTKSTTAESRLEEREQHDDWEHLLNQDEEFAAVLQAPLTSAEDAQQLADQITERLKVPGVKVVFQDGPSSIGDGRLADYLAAEKGNKAIVTFFAEPNARTVSNLVHELAHHTQQVLRGQYAHGAGHNKHFRLVAEALLSIKLGREVDVNEWFRSTYLRNE
jgi:flagellar hook-basal body complex protein FliE